jgi:glyceraldehyde 3-phosphate dehydrogenase
MASMDMMLYLLKNDSVHGTFKSEVEQVDEHNIKIDNQTIRVFSDRDPKNLSFADCGADMVLECTGVFLTQESAQVHIDNGVEKVLFSAPAKDKATPTFVMGVNEERYNGEKIVSNASCTTNCLGPVARVLDDAFGIEKGLMTTIHSYTNDQNILDVKHSKDKRRARAGAVNMIPTTTGAAKAISLVMPQLEGRLHGQSVRVPTPDVSMVDLNVVVKKGTSKEEVTAVFNEAAQGRLKGLLLMDKDMRVSQDFVGCEYSSIVAEDLTQVIGGDMVKIMAWYDNEWGYSMRLVDMALHISK